MMGAESGQLQRIQKGAGNTVSANKNPLEGVSVHINIGKWTDWIKSTGAESVSIIDFYLGSSKTRNNASLTDEDKGFIIREIFLDAVKVGAVKFSKKIDPKDFSFELRTATLPLWTDLVVEYAPPGAKKTKEIITPHDYCLEKKCTTSVIGNILQDICAAIQRTSETMGLFDTLFKKVVPDVPSWFDE